MWQNHDDSMTRIDDRVGVVLAAFVYVLCVRERQLIMYEYACVYVYVV